MKVERIQLPPSSIYGTPDTREGGHRVTGSGDSTQHRRNGRHARKDSEQEIEKEGTGDAPESKAVAEGAAPSGERAHSLNITA